MKKILTLFALLIAFAVNGFADNWYVVGTLITNDNYGDWVYNPVTTEGKSIQMQLVANSENTYYAEFTGVSGDRYFCIADGDGTSWDDFNGNHRYAYSEGNYSVPTNGTSITIGQNGDKSLKLTGDGSNYRLEFNSETKALTVTKSGTTQNATITTVQLRGEWDWGNGLTLTKGTGNEWTGTLDLTSIADNQEFKLVVTEEGVTDLHWIGYKALTVAEGSIALSGAGGDGSNFILPNATIGFKTYTVTATWEECPSAAANWTLKIVGKDAREPFTATFDNGGGWTSVYAYVWSVDGENITNKGLGDWPGTELTKTGDVYNVSIPSTVAPQYIIFHNNKGIQTADLNFEDGQAYTYTINLPGTVIWESETAVEASWYRENYEIIIAKEKFANVKVGDKIHVAVQDVPEVENAWNAQVALRDGWWVDAEGAVNVGGQNIEDASFIITGDMLTLFKQRGMIMSGDKYSTKKITVESTELTGSDLSIWVGPSSTSSVTISGNHFKNKHEWVYVGPQSWDYAFEGIQAGDVIRVSASPREGIEGDIWMVLSYNNYNGTKWEWVEYPDMSKTEFTGGFDFVIPEGNINLIKENGIIVNQRGYTVTQVELITPNGNYYVIYDKFGDEDWMVNTTPMTPDEGTPTAYQGTISDVKFFAIAPNTALNATEDAIVNWAYVIHPNSNDDFLVEFKNYADEATGTSKVWKIADANDATVTINFTAATKAYTITNETTVAIGSTGYATYSNGNMYQVTGATANFVTVSGSEATLVPQDADAILPAMTGAGKHSGIVLSGDPNSEATIKSVAYNATAVDASANLLAGSGDDANGYDIPNPGKFDDTDFYTAYVLKEINSKVGFYKVNDTDRNLAAHKAFLAVPETSTAPSFILIGGGDGTTGINDLRSLTEDASGNIYDLQGRRVENPTKGIYIVNGHKVVIK